MKSKIFENNFIDFDDIVDGFKLIGLFISAIGITGFNFFVSGFVYKATVESRMLTHFLDGMSYCIPVICFFLMTYAYLTFFVSLYELIDDGEAEKQRKEAGLFLLYQLGRISIMILVSLGLYYAIELKGDLIIKDPSMYAMYILSIIFILAVYQVVKRTTIWRRDI